MSETYSLNIITSWLKDKNIEFKYSSAPVDRFGIRIIFPTFNSNIFLIYFIIIIFYYFKKQN